MSAEERESLASIDTMAGIRGDREAAGIFIGGRYYGCQAMHRSCLVRGGCDGELSRELTPSSSGNFRMIFQDFLQLFSGERRQTEKKTPSR